MASGGGIDHHADKGCRQAQGREVAQLLLQRCAMCSNQVSQQYGTRRWYRADGHADKAFA